MQSVLYLSLGDFLVIAEAVLNINALDLIPTARLDLAESALASPQANLEGQESYSRFEDRAAVLCCHIIRNHPLVDGNKRVGYLCLVEFVERNGYVWTPPPGDEHDGEETVRVIEAVAAGTMDERTLADWIAARISAASTKTMRLTVTDGVEVTAKIDVPGRLTSDTPGLVLAHGANNDLDHPLLVSVAARLARDNTALVLRFNFPYAERGGSSPDPRPVLEHAYRRAYDLLVHDLLRPGAPVFVGGKSLGGRFAAEFVAGTVEGEALPAAGLVVLGYPLHAPGRQDRLNAKPLQGIEIPSLFFVGTRDPFCEPELLEPILVGLPHPGRLFVVEGGDHSFHLAKSSGRGAEDAYEALGAEVAAFIAEVAGSA
jgi:uncharacterized protein